MFTLSGLILEARENLFRDFWSPFSISFYFSSERKKSRTDYGPYSARTPPGRGLYKPGQASPKAHPPRNPSRAQPQPRRRRRRQPPRPTPATADSPEPRAARGSPPPRFTCCFFKEKKFCLSFFFFVGFSVVIF